MQRFAASSRHPGSQVLKPRTCFKRLNSKKLSRGNLGAEAMYRTRFHNGNKWNMMRQVCAAVVQQCIPCQRYNIGKHGFIHCRTWTLNCPSTISQLTWRNSASQEKETHISSLLLTYAHDLSFFGLCQTKQWQQARELSSKSFALWDFFTSL